VIAWATALGATGTVTLPLAEWEARTADRTATPAATQVVLGAADWSGVADPETLVVTLDATLQVSLSGPGWKEVPLLATDVVLLAAEVGGQPVAVGQSGDHHTWSTDATGEQTVHLRALVAPTGDRGAVEYDFGVPRTAATHLSLVLPRPDLRPEVAHAVRTRAETVGNTTRFDADLAPTDRVELLGLRDLGGAEARPPKLFAETAHLVSVDERRIEVFSVVRWNILYAGARRFDVFVPEGLEVVSADGEGAFTWTLEPGVGGAVLRGETPYPIRGAYEVSLRLARDLAPGTTSITVPSAVDVEREHGWIGLEAPGRIALADITAEGLVDASVHLLPEALRRASVSPLLRGFRTHGAGAIRLRATPLPEVEVSAERLDAVDAHTIVSASGRAVTELSITLRNRFRPGLVLALPPGASVGSAFLDGEVVVPSRTEAGAVVLPLRRSAPDAPFTVQLRYTEDLGAPGWLGAKQLTLPSLDLPASEVSWDVHLPSGWRWSELSGATSSQTRVGSGRWLVDAGAAHPAPVAPTGLTPPEGAKALHYERYWVPAGSPVAVSTWFVAPALRSALVAAVLAGVAGLVALGWRSRRSTTLVEPRG
jgi:hypothetical protein